MLFLKTCIDQKKILLTWLQADGLLFKEEQLRLNEAFFPERSKRLNCYVTYAKKYLTLQTFPPVFKVTARRKSDSDQCGIICNYSYEDHVNSFD